MSSGLNKVRNRVGYINRKSYKEFIKKYPNSEITYDQYISYLKESSNAIQHYILNN